MTRRQHAQSLDEIFEVDGPEADPAAAQWHTWAVKASKQSVKDLTFLFPFDSNRSSRNSSAADKKPTLELTTSAEKTPPSDDSTKELVVDKRPATMNANNRHLFSDPPFCFCGKVASRSETPEFGVLYDCHMMNNTAETSTRANSICGFHIHEVAWRSIGDTLQSEQFVNKNDPELSTCPYFNFTFCVTFGLSNTMKKSSPRGPQCFCQRRVVLSESDPTERLCFVCPNFYVEGAKPKCSWFLWADELAFTRPKYPRHSDGLREEARARIRSNNAASSSSSTTTESSYHDAQSAI